MAATKRNLALAAAKAAPMQRVTDLAPPPGGATHAQAAGVSLEPRTGWIQCVKPMKKHDGTYSCVLRINGHVYDFRPNAHYDYVAEIPFPDDFASILSIGEGYRPYDERKMHPGGPPVVRQAKQPPTVREQPLPSDDNRPPERGPARPATPRHNEAQTVDPAAG
jgi:hypothetical protein